MKKNGFQLQDFTVEDTLHLMDIYLTEWRYRDNQLWEQATKEFYATLIVLFLPNISSFIGVDLPGFPSVLFPAIASIMSLVFLYIYQLVFKNELRQVGKHIKI